MNNRKHYIDNIRWVTVLLVIVYHIIYMFNSVGVISNIDVQGIAQLDVFLSFVYPWFMCLLFVVGGMSARYSLEKRDGKTFLKERVKRLLVPSVAGIFVLGWVNGWVTDQYVNMFAGAEVPGLIKYLVYCVSGIGPLWFAQELFLASLVLLLVRAMEQSVAKRIRDEQNKSREPLWELGKKAGLPVLLLMVFPVWGSAQILNTPLIEVYRNGIYLFMFLLGYYVFSHENVTDTLKKYSVPLLGVAAVTGVAYVIYYDGENYAKQEVLQNFFTNFYAWIGILAALGCFKRWFDGSNPFAEYMTKRNFGFYVLHYPIMVLMAYLITTYFNLPMVLVYLLVLVLEILLLPLAYELISRIPILKMLLLGM